MVIIFVLMAIFRPRETISVYWRVHRPIRLSGASGLILKDTITGLFVIFLYVFVLLHLKKIFFRVLYCIPFSAFRLPFLNKT